MGIEANFLGEISSELLCPICSFVFDKPATNCKEGHTFCTTCWQSWFTRGNRSCPSCRGKPLNAEPVINRYLSGVIDRLQVRCECGHEFSANHLTTHREEECALRLLDCPLQCGWQGPFSSLRDHLPDGCSMMYTTCPKDGCGMIIRRADLVKHKPHCKPLPKVDEKDSDEQNSAAAAAASQLEPRVIPDAWKRRLKVGDMVDARDRSHNWFEAVVVEVLPGSVKVHFKGWDAKWDEEISLDTAGDRIEPLHSMAPEWRGDLKAGDMVEVKYENLRWGAGRIAHREGDVIRVMDVNDGSRLLGVFPISSDMICKMGTHIKSRQPQNNSSSQQAASTQPPVASRQQPHPTMHPAAMPLGSGAHAAARPRRTARAAEESDEDEEDDEEEDLADGVVASAAGMGGPLYLAPVLNALVSATEGDARSAAAWTSESPVQQQQQQPRAEVVDQSSG